MVAVHQKGGDHSGTCSHLESFTQQPEVTIEDHESGDSGPTASFQKTLESRFLHVYIHLWMTPDLYNYT